MEDRIRMGNVMLVVAIETKNAEITRGGGVGREEEIDDLIEAFDRVLHEEHPNHERIGCPERTALTVLVSEREALGDHSILDHVRQCAPCLDELRNLRMSRKRSQH